MSAPVADGNASGNVLQMEMMQLTLKFSFFLRSCFYLSFHVNSNLFYFLTLRLYAVLCGVLSLHSVIMY